MEKGGISRTLWCQRGYLGLRIWEIGAAGPVSLKQSTPECYLVRAEKLNTYLSLSVYNCFFISLILLVCFQESITSSYVFQGKGSHPSPSNLVALVCRKDNHYSSLYTLISFDLIVFMTPWEGIQVICVLTGVFIVASILMIPLATKLFSISFPELKCDCRWSPASPQARDSYSSTEL